MTNSQAIAKWFACGRKLQYYSERAAQQAATKIRTHSQEPRDQRLYEYPCKYGDHWHIGHLSLDSKRWKEINARKGK